MNIKEIMIQEMPHEIWHKERLKNYRKPQRECNHHGKRIGYGFIINPLEYKDFIRAFEDIRSSDSWIGDFGLELEDGRRINYSARRLMQAVNNKGSGERKTLLELLEQTRKASIGMTSGSPVPFEHIHFRKNGHVYTGSIRVKPYQLKMFNAFGFYHPDIFFIKTDFFPEETCSELKEGLKGGK